MSGKASSGEASFAADKKAIASAMTAAPKKVAAAATRAFNAMMTMKKIDISVIEAAFRG